MKQTLCVPTLWRKATLQDLVYFQRGFDITKAEQKEGNVPVISSSGVTSFHFKAMATGPGVIIGRKGTLGTVYFSESDYWPHDTTLWSKDLKGNYPRFVYYFLQTLGLDHYNVGNANPTLNRNHIHGLKIRIPPLNTQTQIADVISAYDNLIDNNRKRIQLLEESARLLFREWFVYFRFPLRLRSGQAGHGKVHPVRKSNSNGVKIVDGMPEGWKKGSIKDLSKVRSGYAFDSSDWLDEGNPVIKIGNITGDGTVNLDDCSYIDQNVASRAKDFALKKGDLLIAMTGATVGKVGLLSENAKTAYLNQRVGKFIPRFEGSELVLYCFFMSDTAQNHITNYAGGAAQANISASQIESIKIVVAPQDIYNQFISLIKSTFEQILNLRNQNQKLAQARDLLLPRLMSGAIEV